jgi:protein-tyrosine phosphatase
MGRHSQHEPEFRLLFVCTGNICRSPFAEMITRHLLIGRLGGRKASSFVVSSAGVRAVVGSGMQPDSRRQLSAWGLDGAAADRFVARQLRSALVEEAHLVLGASPGHRSSVVERAPASLTTAFSLREFARLTASVDPAALPDEPVARAHSLVELARGRRGLTPPTLPDVDRIPDPMGRPPQAHQEAASMIFTAVQAIVDLVAPLHRPVR